MDFFYCYFNDSAHFPISISSCIIKIFSFSSRITGRIGAHHQTEYHPDFVSEPDIPLQGQDDSETAAAKYSCPKADITDTEDIQTERSTRAGIRELSATRHQNPVVRRNERTLLLFYRRW